MNGSQYDKSMASAQDIILRERVWLLDTVQPQHLILISLEEAGALVARFMGSSWGPTGADRTQVGPMLAPWTLVRANVVLFTLSDVK